MKRSKEVISELSWVCVQLVIDSRTEISATVNSGGCFQKCRNHGVGQHPVSFLILQRLVKLCFLQMDLRWGHWKKWQIKLTSLKMKSVLDMLWWRGLGAGWLVASANTKQRQTRQHFNNKHTRPLDHIYQRQIYSTNHVS